MNPSDQIPAAPPSQVPQTPENPSYVPVVQTPLGTGIEIDNVNKSLREYIFHKKMVEVAIFGPLLVAWEILTLILMTKTLQSLPPGSDNNGVAKGFGYMMAIPVALLAAWVGRLQKQFEAAFLTEFAEANGYNFDKFGYVDQSYGTIFRLPGTKTISDVVTGTYANCGLTLFLYELRVGRNGDYRDTVLELDLHGQLPNLLLVGKKSHYDQLNMVGAFPNHKPVSLEGDFNNFFTLYAPPENNLEALEVFTPDVMQIVESDSSNFTIELANNRIYIYVSGFVTKTERLTQLFTLAKKLTDKLAPLASRMQADSTIVSAPSNLAGKRLSPFIIGGQASIIALGIALVGIAVTIGLIAFTKPPTPSAPSSSNTVVDLTFQTAINKAASLDAQSVSLTNNYGSQIVSQGQTALGAAPTNPDRQEAEYWIGDGYFWLGNNASAVAAEQLAIKYYSGNGYPYALEGNALLDEGQPSNALAVANAGIAVNPNLATLYRLKAVTQADLGQVGAAEITLNQAMALDSRPGIPTQYQTDDQQILNYISTAKPPLYIRP